MGLYLTPYEAIEQHRSNHVDPLAKPSLWRTSCDQCFTVYADRTKAAETAASQAIFAAVPSLTEISWASFFTETRVGATLYGRKQCIWYVHTEESWLYTRLIFSQALI
jgi:hypothetical protein